jgi:carboxymethylenebutenolidase
MDLRTEWVEYPTNGETLPAFYARPKRVSAPLPAALVIQEVWGPDDHIQDVACRLATAGYIALAPDLYAHGGRRPDDLAPERIEAVKAFLDSIPRGAWMNPTERDAAVGRLPEPRRRQVGEALARLFTPTRPFAQYTADLRAGVRFLRRETPARDTRVGSVGFCLGGGLSALLACAEPALAGAIIFYGASPSADQVQGVRCPVLGLYGGEDARINEGIPAFAEAMSSSGKAFEYHVYPGAPHAFFNDTRLSYHVDAARDAWARTLGFFARHLTER